MCEPIVLPNAEATRARGEALGTSLRAHGDQHILVGLSGDLGAGKTTLVGGVLAGSGVTGNARSPTYTLIEPYELTTPNRILYHLDLYRLKTEQELEDLGVRELLSGNNVLLVEWIEQAPALARKVDLQLEIRYAPEGRLLLGSARTPVGEFLLDAVRQQPLRM
jgi:tRNA threonylcarbamoyladenosine biosynthesis protein TsaE